MVASLHRASHQLGALQDLDVLGDGVQRHREIVGEVRDPGTGQRESRRSAARIEEEVVVTDKGCEVITLFPAAELPIANAY